MSKNMTRKGLAFGAGLALVGSGLVASPAFAADTISTDVGDGTIFATLTGAGNGLVLSTVMSPGLEGGNDETLKYLVSNPEGASLTIRIGTTGDALALVDDGTPVGEIFDTATNTDQNTAGTTTLTSFVVTPLGGYVGSANEENFIEVVSASATSITVTPWIDTAAAANNTIDAVEIKETAKTVTFYDKTDITFSTSFVGFEPADTYLEGRITASPAINGYYADAEEFKIGYTREGSTATIFSSAGNWSNVTNSWEFLNANTDSVSLDEADKNWVGLPNVFQIASIADAGGGTAAYGGGDETFTYVLTDQADLNTGDTFEIDFATDTGYNTGAVDTIDANAVYTTNTKTLVITGTFANETDEADSPAALTVKSRAITAVEAKTKTTATITTTSEHGLSVGDVVTVNASVSTFDKTSAVVTSVPSATTFTFAFTTALDAVVAEDATATGDVTYESFDEVVPGDYSAQGYLGGVLAANKIGAKVTAGSIAAVASTISVSATATASVTGNTINSDDATDGGTIKVKAGAAGSVNVTATVYDAVGDAVGAGRPVAFALSSRGATVTVNGGISNGIVNTNASGQVTFTVASSTGANGQDVTITLTPEGNSDADALVAFDVDWETQAFDIYDLNVSDAAVVGGAGNAATMTMVEKGSMVMDLRVLDQWYQAPATGTYSVIATGEGVTDGSYPATASGIKLTVADSGVYDADMVFTLSLYKGTTIVGTANTITVNLVAEGKVNLAADGSSIYGGATADLSVAVAKAALVEIDTRTSFTVAPAYVNNGVITGKVVNKGTSASLQGAAVTLTGPSNVLFTNGAVSKRGSITVLTNASGEFSVETRSTTAQKDTVITVSSLGGSATTKITFTGLTAGEATTLTVTAPDAVKPASTFQVKAKLTDALGNAVDTGSVMKVTYTGPGIVFGTLPTETDANGELMFSVLLGSNDTGNVVVTVSYDQNGDADYVDAKDLNTTKTVVISASGSVATGKVNVGSFNGKLVVYAAGLNGAKISWKVGGKWGTGTATSNYAIFNRPTPVAGATVSVDIYVNGVKTLTKSVVTR
jgi:hypothetical protein